MKMSTLLMFFVVLLAGCTQIDYVGKSYPPTKHVDLYFSEEDISRDYTVMGHLVASASDLISAEKMQKKIIEKAREKGADGVVILGLERYRSGESSTYTEVTKKSTKTATSSTTFEEEKEIRATFIKYK